MAFFFPSSCNKLVLNTNITGNIIFDDKFRVIEGVTINAGSSVDFIGIYDLEFKTRIYYTTRLLQECYKS